ncbi:MAG: DnaJ family domain-containing protein [Pyrinomonadaceae bacterium]
MNRLESLTEKRLREAIENGEFDDLPGKGEPIDLQENPFEDPDLRVVHRLLRNAGFAPAWIEERKDIDAELEAAQTKLSRAWALFGEGGKAPSEAEWERSVKEFREQVAELNRRVRIYNLKAPAAVFHRKHVDADNIVESIKRNANC